MTTKLIKAKTILHYHERPFSTHWDANIYRGCSHRCRYCFAQYSHRHLEGANFFDDVYIKENAAEVLNREFGKKTWGRSPVNVCGVSDCYQPAEATHQIMPGVIASFSRHRTPLVIVSKSTLPLRDIHLLAELNTRAAVTVMASVSILDEQTRQLFEPNAAPTADRLKMLRAFADIGCRTVVLFMPIMPYISDSISNMDEIFSLTAQYNLGVINAWPLHLRGQTKGHFFNFLAQHQPDLLAVYKRLYPEGHLDRFYWTQVKQKIDLLRNKYHLYNVYRRAESIKPDMQLSLF